MIRRACLLALLLCTSGAFAGYSPKFNTDQVEVREGESATVQVWAYWTGLTDYGFHPPWTFASSDATVALVSGGVDELGATGDVVITGRHAGAADIYLGTSGAVTSLGPYVHIIVTPRLLAVNVAASTVTPAFGERVTLTALIEDPAAAVTWYFGHIGDTARPLVSNGRELTIIANEAGPHAYWILARTATASATAEVLLNVQEPVRRRAARH